MTPEGMPKNVGLPYRCLVPASLDGLLAAGRCFSSDQAANTMFNVIPHCVVMGQAAGTAAALAVRDKVKPRKVDYKALKARLIAQGVALPGA
jgi:succinate dehydrogenase/fumarate reductase flavoprotein subunit